MTAALQARVNALALKRLGEDVTLNGVTVRADFAEPYVQGMADGMGAEMSAPQIVLASNDVCTSPRGKTVVARSANYKVASHKPDGYGLSILVLEAA